MKTSIGPIAVHLHDLLQARLDSLTKPRGSLGTLEKIALQIGMIQHTLTPAIIAPRIIVFAGDHGAARDGISAYPQEVTRQMVQNFLDGGAAINVLARASNIALTIVDAGVNHDFLPHPTLIVTKIAYGTQSFIHGAAMSRGEAYRALEAGRRIAHDTCASGCNLIAFGEMGIGNTAAAALLMHHFTGMALADCVGRGTGLDDAGLARKRRLLAQAIAVAPALATPIDALAQFGGYEIVMMAGAMLGAAECGATVVVDGFISGAAMLAARAIDPRLIPYAIFSHASAEQGHAAMLSAMSAEPLLSLRMRLGEGTGAALAIPIIIAATKLLNEMATFSSASVATASTAATSGHLT
jgi:nicotinate-nucleotide--dimethylbenzimidazole phosphoribosyltransferase